ncbi:hypothetical protein INT45_010018 [Circinella minor]|uniref:Uncharacterized protein n=1 Tax=Circinella minor TaxID=1195481 RepID=A0A8H7VQU4_9FUNG|nr:hypothetical protein INT45_010018 [Circinella minor]
MSFQTKGMPLKIIEYLVRLKNNNIPITFQRFVAEKEEYIIEHTTLSDAGDIVNIWGTRFGDAVLEAGVKTKQSKKKIDWLPIMSKILASAATTINKNDMNDADISNNNNNNNNNNNSSSSSSSSSRDKSDGGIDSRISNSTKSGKDMENFKQEHTSFIPNKKWVLSSGRCVEDVMFEYGQKLSHEHPAHSYILCVDDSNWKNVFTEEEINELLNEGNPCLPVLNENVRSILQEFIEAGKKTSQETLEEDKLDTNMLDSLIKTAHKLGPFDPRTQYEQFWVLSAINQLLGYYANDLMTMMGSNVSELDLVARYWSVFDRSFDDVKVITTR